MSEPTSHSAMIIDGDEFRVWRDANTGLFFTTRAVERGHPDWGFSATARSRDELVERARSNLAAFRAAVARQSEPPQ